MNCLIRSKEDDGFSSSSANGKVFGKLVLIAIVVGVVTGWFFWSVKLITIEDKTTRKFLTMSNHLSSFLSSRKISISENDRLSFGESEIRVEFDPNKKISKREKIKIYRAFPVNLVDGEDRKMFFTTSETVGQALAEAKLVLHEDDEIYPSLNDEIRENDTVVLSRNIKDFLYEMRPIPYTIKTVENNKKEEGQKSVLKKGHEGIKQFTYKVAYKNGREVEKKIVKEEILKESTEEVLEIGTKKINAVKICDNPINRNLEFMKKRFLASRDGSSVRYKKLLLCEATAYDASYNSTGKRPKDKGYGVTACGARAEYGMVAVDPRVIPLKSRLYIEAPDKSWNYGLAVASDTGGAIKGHRVDLCFNTENEALNFGRRKANVYILEDY